MTDASLVTDLLVHNDRVWRVRLSPCGTYLVSCSADCSLAIYKLLDGVPTLLQRLTPAPENPTVIRDCAFGPDGQRLFVACYDACIYIYALGDDEEAPFSPLAVIDKAHEKEIKGVAVSRHGTVASCSRDRAVSFWRPCADSLDYECVGLFQAHKEDIKSVTFSPNGQNLVSTSYDNTICVFKRCYNIDDDIEEWLPAGRVESTMDARDCLVDSTAEELIATSSPQHTVWSASFLHDNTHFVVGDGNGCLRYYALLGDKVEQLQCNVELHSLQPIYDAYTVDRDIILTCGEDKSICVARLVAGQITGLLKITNAHDGEVNTVCGMRYKNGLYLYSGGDDGRVNTWSVTL